MTKSRSLDLSELKAELAWCKSNDDYCIALDPVWFDDLEALIEAYEDLDTVRAWCEND